MSIFILPSIRVLGLFAFRASTYPSGSRSAYNAHTQAMQHYNLSTHQLVLLAFIVHIIITICQRVPFFDSYYAFIAGRAYAHAAECTSSRHAINELQSARPRLSRHRLFPPSRLTPERARATTITIRRPPTVNYLFDADYQNKRQHLGLRLMMLHFRRFAPLLVIFNRAYYRGDIYYAFEAIFSMMTRCVNIYHHGKRERYISLYSSALKIYILLR